MSQQRLPTNLFASTTKPRPAAPPAPVEQTPVALPADLPYPIHPAANLFPMMDRAALDQMGEDIATNGQRDPIELLDGKVLEGRNRLVACYERGIVPRVKPWEGAARGEDPIAYVLSKNLHRRHLTPVQRAAVAVGLEKLYAEQARARQLAAGSHGDKGGRGKTLGDDSSPRVRDEGGRAVVQAAKAVGAGIQATKALKQVHTRAPEILPLAKEGRVNVQQALALAEMPAQERPAAIERLQKGAAPKEVLPPRPKGRPADSGAEDDEDQAARVRMLQLAGDLKGRPSKAATPAPPRCKARPKKEPPVPIEDRVEMVRAAVRHHFRACSPGERAVLAAALRALAKEAAQGGTDAVAR